MADTITQTNELQIELKSADGNNQRIIRLSNPREDVTREEIEEALKPALNAWSGIRQTGEIVPFFYDDNDRSVPLTVLGTTEIVRVMKTVRRLL